MTYSWYRTYDTADGFHSNTSWRCAIPSGSTYRRVRFAWGWTGWTSSIVPMSINNQAMAVFGLCTTIGNGSEAVPNPIAASGDADPPTQRWVWWEVRQTVATAVDEAAGVITWRDSGPQEPPDVKVNVLATGIPAGDTLNLWASWDVVSGWDPSGDAAFWLYTSVLYSTP